MRRVLAGLALLALAGCAKEEEPKIAVTDASDRLSPGCYTVDLFDPYEIQPPAANVPPEYAAFLGAWMNGAWDGHWCHDLYVTAVHPDGTVDLLDAYGPWHERKIEATVFPRQGRVEDGVLRFTTRGGTPVEYHVADGYLIGHRSGIMGDMDVTMSRAAGAGMTVGGQGFAHRGSQIAQNPVPRKRPQGSS